MSRIGKKPVVVPEKVTVAISDRKIDVKQEYFIPEWVKNNAKWWSAEEIDDKTFANGIEYLIKVGIIVV